MNKSIKYSKALNSDIHSICTSNAHGGYNMVLARIELNEYTNKVLNVIKAKYDLKDKSEAINKFAEMYGEDYVEFEVKEEYLKKLIKIGKDHIKKYGYKTMTLEELDKICGIEKDV